MLTSLMLTVQSRMELLVPLVVAGMVLGEYVARYSQFTALCLRGKVLIVTLERKLNRPQRSIATRVYRGIIALGIVLIPVGLAGYLLSYNAALAPILVPLVLIACIGQVASVMAHVRVWRRAQQGTLSLELPRSDFLFADTYGVLRHTVLSSVEGFATGIIGATLWFMVGGLPLTLAYLTLAATAAVFHTDGFGWAARSLFRLADSVPRLVAALLLWLAAWFIPHTHPVAACRTRHWQGFVATLLGVSLGGPMPDGRSIPWAGDGTAKLTAAHLARWLLLVLVASILWVGLLAAPTMHKLLNPML